MIVFRTRYLPLKPYAAMAFGYVLLLKRGVRLTPSLLRHETIHWHQCRELLVVPFYVWYLLEWAIRFLQVGLQRCARQKAHKDSRLRQSLARQAYFNIAFEREAYAHQNDPTYLCRRPFWAFCSYLRSAKKRA